MISAARGPGRKAASTRVGYPGRPVCLTPPASFGDAARVLLRFAVLAPSGHNTQPWRFAIRGLEFLVCAHPERRLPVADPKDRELMTNRLAASFFNLPVEVAGLRDRMRELLGSRQRPRCSSASAPDGRGPLSLARRPLGDVLVD